MSYNVFLDHQNKVLYYLHLGIAVFQWISLRHTHKKMLALLFVSVYFATLAIAFGARWVQIQSQSPVVHS